MAAARSGRADDALVALQAEAASLPPMEPTSLAFQAYGQLSPYRVRDHKGEWIGAISHILLAWSDKLRSGHTASSCSLQADELAAAARSIAADPFGDWSWLPLLRGFHQADTRIPPQELEQLIRESQIETVVRAPTNEQECPEDIQEEDAFVASIPPEQLAQQVVGEFLLTPEQLKSILQNP